MAYSRFSCQVTNRSCKYFAMNNYINSKGFGIIILIIGAFYMFLVAWLASWWYVPDYRAAGPDFVSGSSWYTGIAFNIIWSISAPVSSILIVLGFALVFRIERNRILFFVSGSIVFLCWLAFWSVSSVTSVLYGIGGGIIILSFFVSVWSWAKRRPSLNKHGKTAGDTRILGHLFFLIAAWGMCGLLGTPIFGLRPELMNQFNTQNMAITLGAKVLICLVAGWILIVISQFMETYASKESDL